jgi:regulatory protein
MSKEEKYFKHVVAKLENFCAYQERCLQEVMTKLKNFEISTADKNKVVAHLKANRFLDEARFLGSYIRDKFRFKRWGRIRLRQELRQRNINADDIENALEEEISHEAYMQQLAELIAIKNRSVREEDMYKRKQKLAKFALSRGFEMNLIWEALRLFKFEGNDGGDDSDFSDFDEDFG